jgi:hypothetical protein
MVDGASNFTLQPAQATRQHGRRQASLPLNNAGCVPMRVCLYEACSPHLSLAVTLLLSHVAHLSAHVNLLCLQTLFLDGKVQSSEADEWVYHELLVHPALALHPNPKSVYICGGAQSNKQHCTVAAYKSTYLIYRSLAQSGVTRGAG